MSSNKYPNLNSSTIPSISNHNKEARYKVPDVEVNFIHNIKSLLPSFNKYPEPMTFMKENYDCFVKFEKSGSTYFLLGFLLIVELTFQPLAEEKNKIQKFLLNCFFTTTTHPKVETKQKVLLNKAMKNLEDFLMNLSQKSKTLVLNERYKVAKFLCDEIIENQDIKHAILQLGRCSIIQGLIIKDLARFRQSLMSKLFNKGWEMDELYSSTILDIFSETIGFKITKYLIKQGRLIKNTKTLSSNKFEVEILEDGAIKIILYQSGNYFQEKEASRKDSHFTIQKKGEISLQDDLTQEKNQSYQDSEGKYKFIQENNLPSIGNLESTEIQLKKCNRCQGEIVGNLVFTNHSCRHMFCFYCLQEMDNLNSLICYMTNCKFKMDPNELKLFFKNCSESEAIKPKSVSFVPEEGSINNKPEDFSVFRKNNSKNFQTSGIQVDNIKQIKTNLTQNSSFDLNFKESLVNEENKTLSNLKIICSSCQQASLESRTAIGDNFLKCLKCYDFYCLKHKASNKNCLCICWKCQETLIEDNSLKYCNRCLLSYCILCKAERKNQEFCLCAEKKSNNVLKSSNLKRKSIKNQNENSCSVCKDFRSFPAFLKLACGHKLCEFCILVKKDELKKKEIKCLICSLSS